MLRVYAKKLLKLALKIYPGKPKMNNIRAIVHLVTSAGFKALHVPAISVKPFTAGEFQLFSQHLWCLLLTGDAIAMRV